MRGINHAEALKFDIDIHDLMNTINVPNEHPLSSWPRLLQPSSPSSQLSTLLDTLLATVPENATLAELSQHLSSINHKFRQQMAARLQVALNVEIQTDAAGDIGRKKSDL